MCHDFLICCEKYARTCSESINSTAANPLIYLYLIGRTPNTSKTGLKAAGLIVVLLSNELPQQHSLLSH